MNAWILIVNLLFTVNGISTWITAEPEISKFDTKEDCIAEGKKVMGSNSEMRAVARVWCSRPRVSGDLMVVPMPQYFLPEVVEVK